MIIQTWTEMVLLSLQNLWAGFAAFIPSLLGAVVVFVIGLLIAASLEKVVVRMLAMLQADKILDQLGAMQALRTAGMSFSVGVFVGALVRWFFVIAFFLAAADILGLTAVASFLQMVLVYIPNVIVAAIILTIAALVADLVEKFVRTGMRAAEVGSINFVASVVRWTIWIFGILGALSQLGVAESLINTLFIGVVAMFAIAGGLAFGMGGQGAAKEMLEDFRKSIRE